MEFFQIQAYSGFWTGAVVMISVHNMFLSFFLYKTRQTNISNILKIIFNLGNVLRFSAVWGTYMTPKVATILQCTSLQYIIALGNVLVRVSLVAFLLWRLKQVHNGKKDSLIGITLFLIRAGLGIAQLGFQRPTTEFLPDLDITICLPAEVSSQYYVISAYIVELFIDIYVTIRLVQILRKANRNAASISSNMTRKSKRTLFTAVMYWNFLRLFVALLFHLTPALFNYLIDREDIAIPCIDIVNIILSYVITVDAEIVRVIEGKDAKKGSGSAGSEKSFSTSQSPRTPRAPPHYSGHSSNDLPKYSSHTQSTEQENYSQLDEDKVVVVSMKRLSFFEWANVVVGKRFRRNNEEQYDENTEEIIDGPSKPANEDLEKGFPQDRRSSNFSGTTSVSTLDENQEIVIR